MGLDWWKVRVDDAIVADSPDAVLEDCYVRGIADRCNQFTRDATTGAITDLDFALMNFGYIETAGFDLLASWRLPEQSWGNLGFTWDTSYVDYFERQSSPSNPIPVQYAGVAGNLGTVFRVRSNLVEIGRASCRERVL